MESMLGCVFPQNVKLGRPTANSITLALILFFCLTILHLILQLAQIPTTIRQLKFYKLLCKRMELKVILPYILKEMQIYCFSPPIN